MSEWNEPARPESIAFFEKAIPGHDLVEKLKKLGGQTYELQRGRGLSPVKVWLCNVYRVTAADVAEIQAEDPEITAILTISNWNDVTVEGKQAGQELGIGVFTFKDFMGALNYDRDEFVDYRPPERDKKLGAKSLGSL